MKEIFILFLTAFCSFKSYSQSGDFPFGKISYKELEMKTYPADTSAEAVVLNEFGYAWINSEQHIVFEHHTKIKILKPAGQKRGDFRMPLYKSGTNVEEWKSLQATTYNLESSSIKKTDFDPKNLITEKTARYYDYVKFAMPDVRVGSVIEVKYVTESPFLFNFHTWEFQDYIPKVISEYWCEIPVNWVYNISLRGFYKLTKNEITSKEDCYEVPGISGKAPCILTRYAMKDVPAFSEEKYMTAASNYISAIYFEIAEFQGFDGTKVKYSEEWKDVDNKLRQHEKFGFQIKKARNLMEDQVKPIIKSEPDSLKQAILIFEFVRDWYTWNENNGMYAELEVKKAFESKKGNDADINFALIGALQAVNLNADPVLVSTRDFGLPSKVHPQRSGFNYVVARVKIKNQQYLLDATEDYLPFGVLPIRCINDQGRIVSREESEWINLKPTQKQKKSINMELKLNESGSLGGKLSLQYYGYSAFGEREKFIKSPPDEYLNNLKKELSTFDITDFTVQYKDSINKPLIERMNVQSADLNVSDASTFYFNPFMIDRYENNPFKSTERLYPVDLGAPMEYNYYTSIELPENWRVDESLSNKSIGLPNGGGRFLMNVTTTEKKIVMACTISLAKSIYSAEEYHFLREFFSQIVQTQQSQFVFKRIK